MELELLIPLVSFSQKEINYEEIIKKKHKKEFFNSTFYEHQGYFLGDIHGLSNSYYFLLNTLKHLNEIKGIRHVCLERGRDYLYSVNRFIEGENTEFG